jgi:hypothetical protein
MRQSNREIFLAWVFSFQSYLYEIKHGFFEEKIKPIRMLIEPRKNAKKTHFICHIASFSGLLCPI